MRAFLDGLPGATRKTVLALRSAVRRAAPQAEETLLWGGLSYHRPAVGGRIAGVTQKTGAEILKLADKAIEGGGVEQILFHGVGGDWLSLPLPEFLVLLDGLDARKERLWVTDAISAHQYETERAGAEAKVLEAGAAKIRVALSCKADPALYDLPLTLATRVPAGWKHCQVTQGKAKAAATAGQGEVRYDARPGAEEIVIQPAGK